MAASNQIQIPVLQHPDPVVNQIQQNVNKVLRNLAQPQVIPSNDYAQAFTGPVSSVSWSTDSGTFTDPTVSGVPSLTIRGSSNISLTQAPNNYPGITFTPANSTAIYLVFAMVSVETGAANGAAVLSLFDGTKVIANSPSFAAPASGAARGELVIAGIYAPASSSPVTVRLQMAAPGSGSALINAFVDYGSLIEWTIVRIA